MKRSAKLSFAGLELARRHGIDRIRVFSDSALVVNTVNGDWNLQPEYSKTCARRRVSSSRSSQTSSYLGFLGK